MDIIFAKTMLRAYASLEFVANQIDDLIYRNALSTGTGISAQRQVEKVVSLMNKKNNLINLKLVVDEALSRLDEGQKQVLCSKYINKQNFLEFCKLFDISQRTYFRWVANAENAFAKNCILCGYDKNWFVQNYFDQSWIENIFNKIKEKTQD